MSVEISESLCCELQHRTCLLNHLWGWGYEFTVDGLNSDKYRDHKHTNTLWTSSFMQDGTDQDDRISLQCHTESGFCYHCVRQGGFGVGGVQWTCVACSDPVSLWQRAQNDRVTAQLCFVCVTLHLETVGVTVAHLQGKCFQSHLVADTSTPHYENLTFLVNSCVHRTVSSQKQKQYF